MAREQREHLEKWLAQHAPGMRPLKDLLSYTEAEKIDDPEIPDLEKIHIIVEAVNRLLPLEDEEG